MDLESVADELYAAAPEDFMALRTQRVADAKDDGDEALAKEIGTLRRPTKSGWLVNLLARQAPDELQSLIDLGEALREAQQQLSGPDLRRLSSERHKAVDALARRAAALADDEGQSASEAVRQEVAGTLQAALADPSAAEVVLAGRVVSAITYGGFGTIDLGGASTVTRRAAPAKAATAKARATTRGAKKPTAEEAEAAAEREAAIAAAESTLATLAATAAEAEEAREAAAAHDTEADETRVDNRQHVDDLRSELQQAEEALETAEREKTATAEALSRAEAAADQATRDRDEAEALLDQLRAT